MSGLRRNEEGNSSRHEATNLCALTPGKPCCVCPCGKGPRLDAIGPNFDPESEPADDPRDYYSKDRDASPLQALLANRTWGNLGKSRGQNPAIYCPSCSPLGGVNAALGLKTLDEMLYRKLCDPASNRPGTWLRYAVLQPHLRRGKHRLQYSCGSRRPARSRNTSKDICASWRAAFRVISGRSSALCPYWARSPVRSQLVREMCDISTRATVHRTRHLKFRR